MIDEKQNLIRKFIGRGTENNKEATLEELTSRVSDIEQQLNDELPIGGNNAPIDFLDETATLAEVIVVVNLLIKRDLTANRLE